MQESKRFGIWGRMSSKMVVANVSKVATDILSQLSNVLPTGTFLIFQILAPLATNNGKCGHGEVVLTSFTLVLLCVLCCLSGFTDTYKAENGVVYYGFVTTQGLWNPNFRHAHIDNCSGSYYTGKTSPHPNPILGQLLAFSCSKSHCLNPCTVDF